MLIDTMDKLNEVIPSLLACMDPCVDTETTGLNSFGTMTTAPHRIIGVSIDDGHEAYYFPIRHKQGTNLPMTCMDFFVPYLSDPHRTYGGFNYKFDQHMLAADGVPYSLNIEDAMLAVHLLNENEVNFKLKDLCDRYHIGKGSLEESILLEKVNGRKDAMCELNPVDVEPYACDDVRLTRGLLELVKPALRHYGLYEIWKQANYYSYITARMESRGMLIDVDLITRYKEEALAHQTVVNAKLIELAGYPLNPNSSKQVCAFLGVESSSAEVLIDVIDAGGDAGEKAQTIREARGWSSVSSRYYDPYLACVDTNHCIHCSLNLIGTISGRLSCSNPNLQAVAKHTEVFKVKDVFIARPGFTLIQADYKQAEMRLVTFYTKDPVMCELIESGADLHSATAETLNIPRNAAKRINFGVVYGIGADHLAKSLRVQRSVAKGYLDQYHALYPGFRKLIKACEQKAQSDGVITMWTGRQRHFNVPGLDPHKAMSNLIQGGVAEIVRVAISRLFPAIDDLGGYMLLQVHDSVMFEVPDAVVVPAMKAIKRIMEDFDFVPHVGVDIEYGKSWGALEKWDSSVST